MLNVVVIGGGTGSFNLLSGLRPRRELAVASIVTTLDSGGDSGVLRDAFGVLPPGDLRRCLVALSEESVLWRDLFSFRFQEPPLENRQFGNLFFLALTRILKSEPQAIEAIGRILKIRGRVLPVTWEHSHLVAELDNGELIRGESNIDGRGRSPILPPHDPSIPIRRLYLDPSASANAEAVEAIAAADVIVIAPGDVFTSTVPNLLVTGISEAIRGAHAPFAYVLNLMTKHGETDGWNASRHVREISQYAQRTPDAILVHDRPLPEALLARYEDENASPVHVDEDELTRMGVAVHRADVASADSLLRHDPARTADALLALFRALSLTAMERTS